MGNSSECVLLLLFFYYFLFAISVISITVNDTFEHVNVPRQESITHHRLLTPWIVATWS